MNNTDAIEQAYRNGYEDGKRDAVRHGAWKERRFVIFDSEKVGYRCSECNTTWDTGTPYCPNCGAKMDGEIHDKKSQDE